MFQMPVNELSKYHGLPAPWGWGGLSDVVFRRTYSRTDNPKTEGHEDWFDVCDRAISGMYELQKRHCLENGVNWNKEKAERSALTSFDLMFNMKWSPPGRGLWTMGSDFVMKRGTTEALQNCGFISSKFIDQEKGDFFAWIMSMSMVGIGVGFDTDGAGAVTILPPSSETVDHIISDDREGWANSVATLVNAFIDGTAQPVFDYSKIRPKGSAISGFGGLASGPGPLKELHEFIRSSLSGLSGQKLTSRAIVDIANNIGVCVVAGNVRRSALISLGNPLDKDFINLKNYDLNPERAAFGWASNNSVKVEKGMDYADMALRTYGNGEPGYAWMENARNYGRMNGRPMPDSGVMGFNPCAEQPLEHRELCTLVEIFLPRCKTVTEFVEAIKCAYLYGKTVTLASDQIADRATREVMQRNRRIGLSVTGVSQFMVTNGVETLIDWLERGYAQARYYDDLYSQWLGVETSIRSTTVKPSGTISLMAGVTPGIHFSQQSRHHIRRVSLSKSSHLIDPLMAAGYPVEEYVHGNDSVVVSFPVDAGPGSVPESRVPMGTQLSLIKAAQMYWSDNGVSATVKFKKEETTPADIEAALRGCEDSLKAISFLSLSDHGYKQAPYEDISAEEYAAMVAKIKPIHYGDDGLGSGDKMADLFCEGDACEVNFE